MSQVLEEVVALMAQSIVKDEPCQTVGCRGGGPSEIEGVTLKAQVPEGGKLTPKE